MAWDSHRPDLPSLPASVFRHAARRQPATRTQQDFGKRYGGRYGTLLPVTLAEFTETLRSP
eukprot:5340179-Prymnesium_polylepis.1